MTPIKPGQFLVILSLTAAALITSAALLASFR